MKIILNDNYSEEAVFKRHKIGFSIIKHEEDLILSSDSNWYYVFTTYEELFSFMNENLTLVKYFFFYIIFKYNKNNNISITIKNK